MEPVLYNTPLQWVVSRGGGVFVIPFNIILPSLFLNKVAAQNCRKRKLDQILTLADEVKEMRDRKNRLIRERDFRLAEIQRAKEKFSQLYRHVFQVNLFDHALAK
jgi:hypothetical protein